MANDRLDSWKEIAAYLKRDVTTVRRWEKRQGLPVHLHLHERRDSVYAYATEIDTWWDGRRNHLADNGITSDGSSEAEAGSAAAANGARRSSSRRAGVAWAAAALFFITTVALAAIMFARRSGTSELSGNELQFLLFPPNDANFGAVSLSPDGRHIAFTTTPTSPGGGKGLLWIRSLDAVTARPLPDTEDAAFPFWSPTSDAIGFFAGGKLWTISIHDGHPRSIADAPEGRGGTWNRDGTIVFAPRSDGPLSRVSSSGGAAAAVTALVGDDERGHVWPEFLPDGNQFLYLAEPHETRADKHVLFVAALDGRERRAVMPLSSNVAYSPDGYLLFERDHWLHAQRFDPSTAQPLGDPIALIDRIELQSNGHHRAEFSIAGNGRLVYRQMQSPENSLVWRDRTRRLAPLRNDTAWYQTPTFSPDDSRLAVTLFDPRPSPRFGYGVGHVRASIALIDCVAGRMSLLTTDPSANWGPVWSPDGGRIVFTSNRRTPDLELFVKDANDPAGAEAPLVTTGKYPVASAWSPDGRYLVYSAFNEKTRTDLWLLPMSGDQTPVRLVHGDAGEFQGTISPDGRWLAYTSNESGRDEVYVQAFPTPSRKWRVSTDGGGDPRWRRDGNELFYIANDRQLIGVPIRRGAAFDHGDAVAVFDAGIPSYWYFGRNVYDVSRDGRFILMSPIEDDRALPMTVVLDWGTLLRQILHRQTDGM